LQPQDERSHSTSYLVVSSAEKTDATGGFSKRGQGPVKIVTSNVVAVLSNYHFVRDKQAAKFKPCKPADCSVGVKYSSSEFAVQSGSTNTDAGFHFDRFGLLIPYEAFVSLFTSKDFGSYLKKCQERRERQSDGAGEDDEEEDDRDDEENEEDEEVVSKKKAGKKKRAGESGLAGPSKKKAV